MVQFPCQVWLVKMLIKQRHDFTGALWMGCNTDALKKKKKCLLVDPSFLQRGFSVLFLDHRDPQRNERGKNFSQVRRTPTQRKKIHYTQYSVDGFELVLSQQHTRICTHRYSHNRDMLPGLVFFTVS